MCFRPCFHVSASTFRPPLSDFDRRIIISIDRLDPYVPSCVREVLSFLSPDTLLIDLIKKNQLTHKLFHIIFSFLTKYEQCFCNTNTRKSAVLTVNIFQFSIE